MFSIEKFFIFAKNINNIVITRKGKTRRLALLVVEKSNFALIHIATIKVSIINIILVIG